MPRIVKALQSNFSAGEISPELIMRLDTEQYKNGAKSLLNTQLLVGGGGRRRPGSWLTATLLGDSRVIGFTVDSDNQYWLVFSAGRMDAYTKEGVSAGSLTSCPWTAAKFKTMDFASSGNTIIVTHASFLQFITRTGASTWTLTDFPFRVSDLGRIKQPHYKLADEDVTLTPSALTGDITVTASSAYWTSAYVGRRIRILDREIDITGFTSTTVVSGTVIEELRPSQRLSGATADKFAAGDIVEGDTSGAKGIVVSTNNDRQIVTAVAIAGGGTGYAQGDLLTVVGGTGDPAVLQVTSVDGSGVVLTVSFGGSASLGNPGNYSVAPTNAVSVTGGTGSGATFNLTLETTVLIFVAITETLRLFTADDTIIGPNSTADLDGVLDVDPLPVKDWTEQLYVDGAYPACVEIHRGRIMLGGSSGLSNGLASSGVIDIFNFDLGTGGDADGFLETIGDSAAVSVLQLHSTEQLLVFTDRGPYYVPETTANPLRATSIAFNRFGSAWPTSRVKVADFDGGVIFTSGSLVIKASPTGNLSGLWDAREVSFLAAHLVTNPTDATFVQNFNGGSERYGILRNSDGTLAVMMLVDSERLRNFVPWQTTGDYQSVASLDETLAAVTSRSLNGSTVYLLEIFDPDLTLDAVTEYADEAALTGITALYGDDVANIVTDSKFALGTYPLDTLPPDSLPDGPFFAGLFYDRTMETLPPVIDDAQGNHSGDLMRILTANVRVHESYRYALEGAEIQAYETSDDPNLAPPSRSDFRRFKPLGWRREPTVSITQPDPLPLTVLGINLEIAY